MSSPCVSCGTPQPDPPPRFCDGCGLAIQRPRSEAQRRVDNAPKVRCVECGIFATSRRCRGCGMPVRWPDDVVPPDEAELGAPPAPDLELPVGDGEDVDMDDPEQG